MSASSELARRRRGMLKRVGEPEQEVIASPRQYLAIRDWVVWFVTRRPITRRPKPRFTALRFKPEFISLLQQHVPGTTGLAFDTSTQELQLYVDNPATFDFAAFLQLLFPIYILHKGESLFGLLLDQDPEPYPVTDPVFKSVPLGHEDADLLPYSVTQSCWSCPWQRLVFGTSEDRQVVAQRYLTDTTPFRVLPTPEASLPGTQLWELNAALITQPAPQTPIKCVVTLSYD